MLRGANASVGCERMRPFRLERKDQDPRFRKIVYGETLIRKGLLVEYGESPLCVHLTAESSAR
jgi:hypothetical protein